MKALYISNIDKGINKIRFKDIKSNIVRKDVKDAKGLINYIKSSKLRVNFTLKKLDFSRCAEMSNKTNQFNANYCRYKIKEIKSLNKNKNYKIVSFSVSDKYSNSGIISLMVLEYKSTHFIIKEFVISCRALGRGLESFFLNLVIKKFSIQKLIINYIKTDRNMPFIKYIRSIKNNQNKKFYSINLVKVKKNIINYENYIKTKIN
jgi:FkbH-like protein